MRGTVRVLASFVLTAVVATAAAAAQSSARFRATEHVFNAGGHPADGVVLGSASFRVRLDDVAGDPSNAARLTSKNFHADGGFAGAYPPPGEVLLLRFGDRTTLAWRPDPAVGTYDVYRDDVTRLPALGYGLCRWQGLTAPTVSDLGVPPAGRGWFYLVTAENRLAQEGTKGNDSSGAPRGGVHCP